MLMAIRFRLLIVQLANYIRPILAVICCYCVLLSDADDGEQQQPADERFSGW